jgi:hypothetical protein
LAAAALVGVAHIAFLPPWEGFDETAHWSYIQELSDAGHAPRYGVDLLSADLAAYRGPMAYGAEPPYAAGGRLTYRGYRLAGAPQTPGGPTRYAGAGGLNWQAQHPPLYYALMTPVYRAAHGLAWRDHLLVLRLASFALAIAGLALGVWGTLRVVRPSNPWTGPIMAAWPFFFPQFFPEFARLGNDSACLLLAATAWVILLRLLTGEGRWASAVGLGVSLGLGLLTKAFFLPIGAGVGAMLLIHWWTTGRRAAVLARAATAGALALAIGGWWYLDRALQTGSVVGADEFIRLHQAGGLAILGRGVSPAGLARGLAVIPATFAWAGTWSLARFSEVLLLPLLALFGLTMFDYARGLTRKDLVGWAPAALAAPVLAGLGYHVLVALAGAGATTPGWYLHILAAPLGLAVARGWKRPRLLAALTVYTGLYAAAAWAFQLSLFSGCAVKADEDKHYSLAGAGCFIDPHALTQLGHPLLGAACLAAAAQLAVIAGLNVWRSRQTEWAILALAPQ